VRLRDSRSRELVEVGPGPDGRIGIYVCGPTVYGRIHVGNARPFAVFQLVKRYLEWRGQPVTLVENITDVNDKIYRAARPLHVPSDALAREMIDAYVADTDRLGLGRPDVEPRATATVPEIVALIEELVSTGHAYEAGGDVYFSVRSYCEYGRLSGRTPDEQLEGARVEPGEHKRDPLDFVLWKANKPDEDTSWESPWGRGRPGWHIECSAMAERWLGREFAVHSGGRDLIFPHHENEIAQSRAAGRGFARVWAHVGMLQLAGEKMSKSLGNIDPLFEVLDEWGAETLIMLFLRAHYSAPIDYTEEAMGQARSAVETLRNRLRDGAGGSDPPLVDAVCEALDDDFNTPRALALLFGAPPASSGAVAEVLGVLGLGGLSEEEQAPAELIELARSRDEARAARDFGRADELRDRIRQAGWEARDTPEGTALYRRDAG
jgi:cysteinyl-tRNA synthetase